MLVRRSPEAFRAFTLLEVILALVILGGSVALLGEVMRLADRAAVDASIETRAQSLAASVMDQLTVGAIELSEVAHEPLEVADDEGWVYSIAFLPCDVEGLRAVEVAVAQDLDARMQPVTYRLVRWMPADPSAAAAAETATESPSSQIGGPDA